MERFFTHAETLSSKREGPLGLYIDEFAEQVSQQGYSRQYARRRLQLVAELSHWLRRRDLAVADLTLTHLENYLRFRARSRRRRPGDAASLKVFFELLHQKGLVIAPIELVDKTPIDELQDEFRLYLRQERVLAPSTVIHYASFAKELLQHRFGIGPADLSLLSAADVVGFVQHRASTATIASAQSTAAPTHSAAGQVTHGKLIRLGKTFLHSPKTGTTATPAAHSTPTQIIDEPALIKLMHQTNANVAMPKSLETPASSKNASIGFGGSTFTVNGLDNADILTSRPMLSSAWGRILSLGIFSPTRGATTIKARGTGLSQLPTSATSGSFQGELAGASCSSP
jgi:hypothetical protein